MIPWGLRWNSWRWKQVWIYTFLWRNHPVIVILAGIGALLVGLGVFSLLVTLRLIG